MFLALQGWKFVNIAADLKQMQNKPTREQQGPENTHTFYS